MIFDRPWFGTLIMAIGMMLCLLVNIVWIKLDPAHAPKLRDIPLSLYFLASLPSLCDILLSMFYSYSIVVNDGSISIALRFFNLLFIVIINTIVFRPKNYAYKWVALAIVLVGIIFVSCSVLIGLDSKLNVLAVILQIIAQII